MISTNNEWDTLKSIFVGSAWGANKPQGCHFEKTGPYPNAVTEQADIDLNNFVDVLKHEGVKVYRPIQNNFVPNGMYNYCPRDRLLIAGETIVDPAMMYPCRDMEWKTLANVTAGKHVKHMPRDEGMTLDAANVCRLGDTWLYLESESGNHAAYEWLCEQFPNINIELVNFYQGVHIDSTIVPLREGVVMVNAERVMPEHLPKALQDWEIIWIWNVVPQDFYEYPWASKWIAMNTLSIDPETVIVDTAQTEIITTLEKRGFTVVPHTLRHSRTLGGGFHCVTLDLKRG